MVVNGQIMQTIKTIWSHWGSGSGYVQECEQMDRFFVQCLTIQNFAKYYPNKPSEVVKDFWKFTKVGKILPNRVTLDKVYRIRMTVKQKIKFFLNYLLRFLLSICAISLSLCRCRLPFNSLFCVKSNYEIGIGVSVYMCVYVYMHLFQPISFAKIWRSSSYWQRNLFLYFHYSWISASFYPNKTEWER